MTALDRRSLFALAAAAAAGTLSLPAWLQRAFAPQDPVSDWRVKQLRAAVATAKEHGKPLLVLVVPDPKLPNECTLRGSWLGAWLDHASAQALHGIALCTVACATLDEVQQATGAKRPEGDVTMLLIDVAKVGDAGAPAPRTTPVSVDLGPIPRSRRPTPEEEEAAQKAIEAGFEKLANGLQDGLNRHGGGITRLATEVTTRLAPAQRKELDAWLAGGTAPADELIVRAAAEVRRAAADLAAAPRKRVLDHLAQAVAKQIREHVAGSTWEDGTCPPCGMAAIPPLCERFLCFYVQGK